MLRIFPFSTSASNAAHVSAIGTSITITLPATGSIGKRVVVEAGKATGQ